MEPKLLHKYYIQNREQLSVLGEQVGEDGHIPIGILQEERRKGLWLLGNTGTGKSQLLLQMALKDIQEGRCVIFLDPFGTSAEYLIPELKGEFEDKLFYFNALHIRNVLGLPVVEDFVSLIKARQIFITDLEFGKIGADKVNIYGSEIINRIYKAAQNMFQNRRDIYIYIDEAQMFQGQQLNNLLAHSQSLMLNITLAHQFRSQVDPENLTYLDKHLYNHIWFPLISEDLEWVEKNISKELSKKITTLGDEEFIVSVDAEEGKRINEKAKLISS